MSISRRQLAALAAALVPTKAQNTALATKAYVWEDLPVKANGENRGRAIFDGRTSTSFPIEMHETELAPGLAPHGSHKHLNDEIFIVREGTIEAVVNGRTTILTPGSVVYINANEEHGFRNAGATRSRHYIIALGAKK
jgi:mannose-6-phosphate isomerase-like protein (cupin superfamily)